MNIVQRCAVFAFLALIPLQAQAAGTLVVEQAWIPPAPPGMAMYAGYAVLANRGDAELKITAAESPQFDDVSIHETVVVDGVSKMRALDVIAIAPGSEVVFAPGGRHIMLMEPRSTPVPGATVAIDFVLDDGRRVTTAFTVRSRDEAPGAAHPHHH